MASDKLYDRMLETSLRYAGQAAELARLLYEVTKDYEWGPAHDVLLEYEYIDEDGEWRE